MSLRPQSTKSGLGYERTRPHIELLQNCSLRLSPRPVMALELGTHPKPTQIADALVKDGLAVEAEGVFFILSGDPDGEFAVLAEIPLRT